MALNGGKIIAFMALPSQRYLMSRKSGSAWLVHLSRKGTAAFERESGIDDRKFAAVMKRHQTSCAVVVGAVDLAATVGHGCKGVSHWWPPCATSPSRPVKVSRSPANCEAGSLSGPCLCAARFA
jgi:hypothetical protein